MRWITRRIESGGVDNPAVASQRSRPFGDPSRPEDQMSSIATFSILSEAGRSAFADA